MNIKVHILSYKNMYTDYSEITDMAMYVALFLHAVCFM
jgi:hypothetical protein